MNKTELVNEISRADAKRAVTAFEQVVAEALTNVSSLLIGGIGCYMLMSAWRHLL